MALNNVDGKMLKVLDFGNGNQAKIQEFKMLILNESIEFFFLLLNEKIISFP